MIIQKKEDYRIYVEDDNKNYLSTRFVNEAQEHIDKFIETKIRFNNEPRIQDRVFELMLTKEEIIVMSNLLNECVKLL